MFLKGLLLLSCETQALCLGIATFINVVMLILAGTVFFPERVVSLEQGAQLMEKTMGSTARGAFAVAMLCAGQCSSLSGVLSTQYIMEGFFQMNVPSWIIRLVTRIIAIIPAFYIVFSFGPDSAAELIEQAQVCCPCGIL
jgi:manganese transport protein